MEHENLEPSTKLLKLNTQILINSLFEILEDDQRYQKENSIVQLDGMFVFLDENFPGDE